MSPYETSGDGALGRGEQEWKRGLAVACAVACGIAAVIFLWVCWRTVAPEDVRGGGIANSKVGAGESGALPHEVSTPNAEVAQRTEVGPSGRVSDTGVLRVHVKWSDGTPAPGMAVALERGGLEGWFGIRLVNADARGVAEFTEVAPGPVVLAARHGGSLDCAIVEGETVDVDLTIPPGIDVLGTVVDSGGKPVAGAIIVVGRSTDLMLDAGATDANGAFFLRAIGDGTYVSAFAEGFATAMAQVTGGRSEVRIELHLEESAVTVTGRVFNENGGLLAGAWVAAGRASGRSFSGGFLPMRLVCTDAAGAFRLEAVRTGTSCPIYAGALGHAIWRGEVRAATGESAYLEIQLARAVRLEGTVRSSDGTPGARASVAVEDVNATAKGIADPRPFWARPRWTTGDDGAFRFANLPPGRLRVSVRGHAAGVAYREFEASPGDELLWDPVLEDELQIHGSLSDELGRPLVGWKLFADPLDGGIRPPDGAKTDAAGGFEVKGCAEMAYTVRCYAPDNLWRGPLLTVRGVEPSDEALTLRVRFDRLPSSFVTGRIANLPADTEGTVSVRVMDRRGGSASVHRIQPGERFEIGPLPGGALWIQAHLTPSRAFIPPQVVSLGYHELVPGQRLDLGEVRFPEYGQLVIELADAAGHPVEEGRLSFAASGEYMGGAFGVQIEGGRGKAQVQPGWYLPTGSSLAEHHVERPAFEVRGGQETVLRLRLAQTMLRTFRFDLTTRELPLDCIGRWLKGNQVVKQTTFHFWQRQPTEVQLWHTAGDWQLDLHLPDGTVHSFPFTVAPGPSQAPIEVQLYP